MAGYVEYSNICYQRERRDDTVKDETKEPTAEVVEVPPEELLQENEVSKSHGH